MVVVCLAANGLPACVHRLHLLTPRASSPVVRSNDRNDSALSEELGVHERLEGPTRSLPPTRTVRPRKGATPHIAPAGAEHFNCVMRRSPRIEQNDTTKANDD